MTRPVGWKGDRRAREVLAAAKGERPEGGDEIVVDVDSLLAEDSPTPPGSRAEEVAHAIGVDLRNECPVCRSVDPCDCTEDERTFVRRIRHECEVQGGVPRCSRCRAPLSVLHLPRPNAHPPYDLKDMVGAMGCLPCLTGTLGVTAMAAWLKL